MEPKARNACEPLAIVTAPVEPFTEVTPPFDAVAALPEHEVVAKMHLIQRQLRRCLHQLAIPMDYLTLALPLDVRKRWLLRWDQMQKR